MAINLQIRFYEELNDFIPSKYRKKSFDFQIMTPTTVKDLAESFGVPHTEIDLILANNRSVGFEYLVENRDRIAIYPKFESFDIKNVTHLRPEPLRNTKFILDVHLGKLARYLRMLGFDCLYRNDYPDSLIIETAVKENRIILTRDIGILKHKSVTHGYFIRNQKPANQLNEVIRRFDLNDKINLLSRCIECNGKIVSVLKEQVEHMLLPRTKEYFKTFFQCSNCKKIYWEGSHYKRIMKKFENYKTVK